MDSVFPCKGRVWESISWSWYFPRSWRQQRPVHSCSVVFSDRLLTRERKTPRIYTLPFWAKPVDMSWSKQANQLCNKWVCFYFTYVRLCLVENRYNWLQKSPRLDVNGAQRHFCRVATQSNAVVTLLSTLLGSKQRENSEPVSGPLCPGTWAWHCCGLTACWNCFLSPARVGGKKTR